MQYVTTATFLLVAYSKYLKSSGSTVSCGGGVVSPADLVELAHPGRIGCDAGFQYLHAGAVLGGPDSRDGCRRLPRLVQCVGRGDPGARLPQRLALAGKFPGAAPAASTAEALPRRLPRLPWRGRSAAAAGCVGGGTG